MPATEQTWRNPKLLHLVFAVTGVLMLVTTLWMLAADHLREWKEYQRTFRSVENWTAASRVNEKETDAYRARERQLTAAVDEARAERPDAKVIERFKAEVERFHSSVKTQAETAKELFASSRTKEDELSAHEWSKSLKSVDDEKEMLDPVTKAEETLPPQGAPAAEMGPRRDKLFAAMQAIIRKATFDEGNISTDLKSARADLDVARSRFNIRVGEGAAQEELDKLQENVDFMIHKVDHLVAVYQALKTHRMNLQSIAGQLTDREDAARKALSDHETSLALLEKAVDGRWNTFWKEMLAMPIVDAFGKPLKIDQIWLPQLTLNNNFRDVARFDRCTTCHQGIEKTAPGSATMPGYLPTVKLTLVMQTPRQATGDDRQKLADFDQQLAKLEKELNSNLADEEKKAKEEERRQLEASKKTLLAEVDFSEPPTADQLKLLAAVPIFGEPTEEQRKLIDSLLHKKYGAQLARRGLLDPQDVTLEVVWPETHAAKAKVDRSTVSASSSAPALIVEGLQAGDVIEYINDVQITNQKLAVNYLLESVDWGKPIKLGIRRGMPHPYSSHPRLDLFLGSLSPHKINEFGCTICHDGQGSATAFKWASHTPDNVRQEKAWATEHGWFNNHHWIYPMRPARFAESNCLKCHHSVSELMPSKRFPDPPAPKLVAGYEVIREYGCFGCHEINGFETPEKRRGPDLRAEPAYFAAAAQLLSDPKLPADRRKQAEDVIAHPELPENRHLLAEFIRADQQAQPSVLSPDMHKLANILGSDEEAPGQFRKVGPSLRYVKSKLGLDFLYRWIREPKDFRPTTKMPQFFGLYDHLEEGSKGLDDAKKFEPVEIRAVAEYLLDRSQDFEYLGAPSPDLASPSFERGQKLFQIRGCLACHQHADFPEAKSTQGPNLSRIAAKLIPAQADPDSEPAKKGRQWLYNWVREPNRYHARTVMPNLFLNPIPQAEGPPTDAAADITAYLLRIGDPASDAVPEKDWAPKELTDLERKALAPALDAESEQHLDELARMFLGGTFTKTQAADYVKNGIPAAMAADLKGDEVVLLRSDDSSPRQPTQQQKKLLYVGKRTISRLGCAGCHDIPGYEDAKPIGTGLADWGRKETSKLAFEQILTYLAEKPPGDHHQLTPAEEGHGHGLHPEAMDDDTGFYLEALMNHEREGFIWQKLREPRSYDFKLTENKDYTDRLRMPKFPIDAAQREAAITFVLGLVSEPPAARYVYGAKPRDKSILEGKRIIEKYNCAGCHMLEMETWDFDYDPNNPDFGDPNTPNEYSFLLPHFTPQELQASKAVDRRGLGHAEIVGLSKARSPEAEPEDPDLFTLYKHVPINGYPRLVGGADMSVPRDGVTAKRPTLGGDLARLVFALGQEKKLYPEIADAKVAWGWGPPPLIGEGTKVQTQWLHDFLLNPYPIRPAAVLRMPKFNMSSEEAGKLVDYFAAMDNADYPYENRARSVSPPLDLNDSAQQERLGHAFNLIRDSQTYCVKCHKLGDYSPAAETASQAALAPRMDQIYRRLRPDFVRNWIANPARTLPYTAMPVNFPAGTDPNEVKRLAVYPNATTEEALQGVVDLLMNYDTFMESRQSIKKDVQPPPATPPATATATGE